jgi:hypothetical protein
MRARHGSFKIGISNFGFDQFDFQLFDETGETLLHAERTPI